MTQIKLSNNPQDYGLPQNHESWRPRQDEICEKVLSLEPGTVLIIEAPCGYGKSAIPAVVSHFRPGATVLLGTTDLQSQYVQTLPMFKSIWGQGRSPNYCIHPEHISQFKSVYGTVPFRSECKFKKPSMCPCVSDCPYEIAKAECMSAQARVLNFHYANYARWWKRLLGNESDLFVDEAHGLPMTLSSLVSVEMKDGYRKRYGLPQFPIALGGAPVMLRKAAAWASSAEAALLPLTHSRDIKLQRMAKNKRNELGQLAATLRNAENAEWYIESRPGEGFFARPVVPGPYSSRLLDPGARNHVLMSATIGGEKGARVLAQELGIEEYEFVTYPHIFPQESRPVLFYKNAPKMSYSMTDKEKERQIDMIADALKGHNGEKGIVHTSSWKHAEMIARGLRKRGYDGDIVVPRGDRVKSIKAFRQMSGSVAVISPSWKEGLSFDGDMCRWTVIAKMAYPSFADPVVKLRVKRPGGRAWLDWMTALKTVQAAGRGVRSADDYAITYIMDGNWTRVARMAPGWFDWEKV